MQEYKEMDVMIILFEKGDVITASPNEVDDLGEWNKGWFTQNNG